MNTVRVSPDRGGYWKFRNVLNRLDRRVKQGAACPNNTRQLLNSTRLSGSTGLTTTYYVTCQLWWRIHDTFQASSKRAAVQLDVNTR